MLRIYGDAFVTVVNHISHITGMIEMQGKRQPGRHLSEEVHQKLIPWVAKLDDLLEHINAPATRAASREAHRLLEDPKSSASRVAGALDQLILRFQAELEGQDLMLLDREETRLSSAANEGFGKVVADAFPAAVEDIYEAAKCAAFHRFTASVFHLMRAMECAVQELSETLHIPNPDREWGKLLSDMAKKIEAMPKGDARDAWSENHALLYHVKQAWRNKTMHPKKTYTDEEAHGVYVAVRSFMRHLAPLVV